MVLIKTESFVAGGAGRWIGSHEVCVNADFLASVYTKSCEFIVWELTRESVEEKLTKERPVAKAQASKKEKENDDKKDKDKEASPIPKARSLNNLKMSVANTGLVKKKKTDKHTPPRNKDETADEGLKPRRNRPRRASDPSGKNDFVPLS
jgi:hypothetical protein